MLTLANLESLAELHNRSLLGTSESSNQRRRGGLSLRHRSISKDLKFGQAKDASPFVPKEREGFFGKTNGLRAMNGLWVCCLAHA